MCNARRSLFTLSKQHNHLKILMMTKHGKAWLPPWRPYGIPSSHRYWLEVAGKWLKWWFLTANLCYCRLVYGILWSEESSRHLCHVLVLVSSIEEQVFRHSSLHLWSRACSSTNFRLLHSTFEFDASKHLTLLDWFVSYAITFSAELLSSTKFQHSAIWPQVVACMVLMLLVTAVTTIE